MKRHAAKMEEKSSKVNYGKKKMQEDAAMRKMKSPDMLDYMNKLQTE